jgi:hypothetical protein
VAGLSRSNTAPKGKKDIAPGTKQPYKQNRKTYNHQQTVSAQASKTALKGKKNLAPRTKTASSKLTIINREHLRKHLGCRGLILATPLSLHPPGSRQKKIKQSNVKKN